MFSVNFTILADIEDKVFKGKVEEAAAKPQHHGILSVGLPLWLSRLQTHLVRSWPA